MGCNTLLWFVMWRGLFRSFTRRRQQQHMKTVMRQAAVTWLRQLLLTVYLELETVSSWLDLININIFGGQVVPHRHAKIPYSGFKSQIHSDYDPWFVSTMSMLMFFVKVVNFHNLRHLMFSSLIKLTHSDVAEALFEVAWKLTHCLRFVRVGQFNSFV